MHEIEQHTENSRLNSPLYPNSARRALSASLISTTSSVVSNLTFSADGDASWRPSPASVRL